MKAYFDVEHWHGDQCLRQEQVENTITDEGKDIMLEAVFSGGPQYTWYFALVDGDTDNLILPHRNDSFGLGTDPNWPRISYANVNSGNPLPAWTTNPPTNGKLTSHGTMSFDPPINIKVRGIYLQTANTAVGSAYLWCVALFDSIFEISGATDNVLKIRYTLDLNK